METLEIMDFLLLVKDATPQTTGFVMGEFNPACALTKEEEARRRLKRLLEDPDMNKKLPRWMRNPVHEKLAMRFIMDNMFTDFVNRKMYTLALVKKHYRSRPETLAKGDRQIAERRVLRQKGLLG